MEERRTEEQGEEHADERRFPGAGSGTAPSDVDAMGQDKRRNVVGQRYGASARKQLTIYGIFLGVLAALAIGFLTVVNNVDNREIPLEDTAPWTAVDGSQEPARDLDFPRNGPENTIPANEIGRAVGAGRSDSVSGG